MVIKDKVIIFAQQNQKTMERLGMLLIGKRYGIFKNDKGEYCQVSRFYDNNKEKYSIIFCNVGSIANKPSVHTIMEKKVVKILKEGSYSLNQ